MISEEKLEELEDYCDAYGVYIPQLKELITSHRELSLALEVAIESLTLLQDHSINGATKVICLNTLDQINQITKGSEL